MMAEPELADTLRLLSAGAPETVTVDLGAVTFTDSVLPNFLVSVRQAVPETAVLVVSRPTRMARLILRLTDMAQIAIIDPPAGFDGRVVGGPASAQRSDGQSQTRTGRRQQNGAVRAGDRAVDDHQRSRPVRGGRICRATTILTSSELTTLTALAGTTELVSRALACELETGHESWHVAFTVAAHNGEQWWWLRWAERHRDVVQIDPCGSTRTDGPQLDDCLLPGRHPGPHSFDIQARVLAAWDF